MGGLRLIDFFEKSFFVVEKRDVFLCELLEGGHVTDQYPRHVSQKTFPLGLVETLALIDTLNLSMAS